MEQRGPGAALGILAIGGLILLMTQQRRAEAAPPTDGALPGAGAATVGGSIQEVQLAQGLQKTVGSTLAVVVVIQGGTNDAQGNGMAWPYFVVVRIGHNTVFGFREAGRSGLPDFIDATTGQLVAMPWSSIEQTASFGGQRFFGMPSMVIPDDPGVTWDIHVQLRARQSDASGQPLDGVWQSVGPEFKLDGAFTIAAPADQFAQIGGSVQRVSVAQPPASFEETRPGLASPAALRQGPGPGFVSSHRPARSVPVSPTGGRRALVPSELVMGQPPRQGLSITRRMGRI